MPDHNPETKGQPGLVPVALFGLCPKCGGRTLFDGIASFAPKCRACGLDFANFNVGDGPAAFLTLIVGALVTVLAGWLALGIDPPLWVYVAVLLPVTVGAIIGGLRIGKSVLIAMEFRKAAGEGRRVDE